jgi:F-box protein 18 (helicase)
MNITKQQKDILKAVKKYKSIKINAFAGTGKTTTLKLIASENKDKKILYLAFNSAIKNEASSIFPNNTNIKTTHGLAYAAIKKHTNIDLSNLRNYRAIDISKEFEITYNQAVSALKIFENYCNNAKRDISKTDIEHDTAIKMFNLMLLGKMNPTHGFYLKYYYLLLLDEQITQFTYDIIMLDEAQDTNEVTIGIYEQLKAKTKIFVGDEHQQIYSFRGSKNALNKIQTDKKLYLSMSFRFNEEIATYANILLNNFKNEEVEIESFSDEVEDIKTNGYISRTNAQLIGIIAARTEARRPFVTVRDPKEIFDLTTEVHYFLNEEKELIRKNRFLKDFYDEDELSDYAKEVEDFELRSAIKIAKEYKDKIFAYKEIADKFYKAWQNRAMNGFEQRLDEILFLTTAHTAKGLEWDKVTVADDFTDFAELMVDLGCDSMSEFKKALPTLNSELVDEFNLFYVAITRAKKELLKDSENFHYLLSKDMEKLIDKRIKDIKDNLESVKTTNKKKKATKLTTEEKSEIRREKNLAEGKAKNAGLKWSLEDKIKAKSMFNKNKPIDEIASKLERTNGSILGELVKSEVITNDEKTQLSELLKQRPKMAKKDSLEKAF